LSPSMGKELMAMLGPVSSHHGGGNRRCPENFVRFNHFVFLTPSLLFGKSIKTIYFTVFLDCKITDLIGLPDSKIPHPACVSSETFRMG
jgi:hypothetical protein